jgi:CTP:molybdopterin cytidylyltransferase MocA
MEDTIFGQTSCIILSAGNSERMGEPKALLKFSKDKTFIQKITGTYVQCGVRQVIVVVNKELYNTIQEREILLVPEVQLVINSFPEKGRFFSLQTGVHKLKPGNSCFFQNIDNPFTSDQVLISLIQNKEGASVIIPVFQSESGHPVLINPVVVQKIIVQSDTSIRIDLFLKSFAYKKIEIDENRILTNINSPEDFTEAGLGKIE